MNYIDTDDFNNIKNFKEFLNLRFGKRVRENGDEKMDKQKNKEIIDEIEQQNKKLDEMYNDIKYKLKEYYNLEYNKRDILRKNIQKQLKDLIGINESSIEIDFIELRIYVKRHKKIIYDIVKIAEIAENINYEINSIELDDRGLYLTFNEI
jgi:hypothetical protein